MNQEITVSKSIVSFLWNNQPGFKINNVQRCVEIIEQNLFVTDKENFHYKNIFNETDFLPDCYLKDEIKKLIEFWSLRLRKDVDYFSSSIEELELAEKSEDKILFSPLILPNEIKKIKRQKPLVEIHNANSLIKPEYYHRLKNAPTSILFENGICYDLNSILLPFLKSAKEIKIIDQYLPNPLCQFNLRKLFQIIHFGTKVTLVFSNRRIYVGKDQNADKKKNYDSFLVMTDILKNDFKMKLEEFDDRKHIDRYIITDKLSIRLPSSLDFLDVDGRANIISKDDIQRIDIDFI